MLTIAFILTVGLCFFFHDFPELENTNWPVPSFLPRVYYLLANFGLGLGMVLYHFNFSPETSWMPFGLGLGGPSFLILSHLMYFSAVKSYPFIETLKSTHGIDSLPKIVLMLMYYISCSVAFVICVFIQLFRFW